MEDRWGNHSARYAGHKVFVFDLLVTAEERRHGKADSANKCCLIFCAGDGRRRCHFIDTFLIIFGDFNLPNESKSRQCKLVRVSDLKSLILFLVIADLNHIFTWNHVWLLLYMHTLYLSGIRLGLPIESNAPKQQLVRSSYDNKGLLLLYISLSWVLRIYAAHGAFLFPRSTTSWIYLDFKLKKNDCYLLPLYDCQLS